MVPVRNKLCYIIIFLFGVSNLTGCSNYKELNEISIVVGLGIDYIPSKKTYQVIYQSINPSENVAQSSGSGATSVTSYISTGKTLSEAAYNTSRLFSRQNLYSHIQVLILGEQLAKKESLNFIFDVFERDAGVRVNVPVLIARDDNVKTTMDILPSNDKIPVRTIIGKLRNASRNTGEYGETKVYKVIENLSNLGTEPAINGISIRGNKKQGTTKANLENMEKAYVTLNGVAMFRKGRLVGWLDGKKTKSIQIVHNKIINTVLSIHCDEKRYNTIVFSRLKTQPKVDIKNNQAFITINTNASGAILELLCNKDISKREVMKEYEQKAERVLAKEIKEGIVTAQKVKSDVFGFGEILHYTHLGKWDKVKDHWAQMFSQAKVNVHVKVDIERTGMRIKPYPY